MQQDTLETGAALPKANAGAVAPVPGSASLQRPWRTRVLWVAGIAIVLALLVLTPPLVNANRYRGKIAESMSKSLGCPGLRCATWW